MSAADRIKVIDETIAKNYDKIARLQGKNEALGREKTALLRQIKAEEAAAAAAEKEKAKAAELAKFHREMAELDAKRAAETKAKADEKGAVGDARREAAAKAAKTVKPDVAAIEAYVEKELPYDWIVGDPMDDTTLTDAIPSFTDAKEAVRTAVKGGPVLTWPTVKKLGFYFYGGNGSGVGNITESIVDLYPDDDPNYAYLSIESKDVDTLWRPEEESDYTLYQTTKPTKADIKKYGPYEEINTVAFIITYKLKAYNNVQARNTMAWFKAFEAAVEKHTSGD